MKICPKCHKQYDDKLNFCKACGTKLEQYNLRYCPGCCSSITNDEAKFCKTCGLQFSDEVKPLKNKPLLICPHCGHKINDSRATVCYSCRKRFDEKHKPIDIANNPFKEPHYRVCTHCGASYEVNPSNVEKDNCPSCGKLLYTMRNSPDLTEEETEKIEKRLEEEKQAKIKIQKEQEKRQKEQAEKAKKLEEERLENERRKKAKKKKIIKISAISFVALCVLCIAAVVALYFVDLDRMSKAEEALAAGNYNAAIDYYNVYLPVGKVKQEADSKMQTVVTAKNYFETAKDKLSNYEYLEAMKNADCAKRTCPELKGPQELFSSAQADLEAYFVKKFNSKDYTAVLAGNEVPADWRTDKTTELVVNVNNMIVNHVKNGTAFLKAEKPEDALKSADAALAIDKDNTGALDLKNKIAGYYVQKGTASLDYGGYNDALTYADKALKVDSANKYAKKLKTNANDYKTYLDYIDKAQANYNKGNISSAYSNLSHIPTSGIGSKVRSKYSGFCSTIYSDYDYRNKPVLVSNKNTNFWYSRIHWNDYTVFTFELENRLSRPVNVTVELKSNNDTIYCSYYLMGSSTKYCTEYLYNTYNFSSGNDSDITVYSFYVQ